MKKKKVTKKEVVKKVKKTESKVKRSDAINLWVKGETKLERVSMKQECKSAYIQKFGVLTLVSKIDFENWYFQFNFITVS